jgi:DNA polymerase-3 subunit alpha (Gram-positive type)
MATLISLKCKGAQNWAASLGELSEAESHAFSQMGFEGMDLNPDRNSVRLYLDLGSPADPTLMSLLKEKLAYRGYKPVLYPRYAEGSLTAEEWLGLHFRDLMEQVKEELDLAPDWLQFADYRLEGELGRESLMLLAESDFLSQTLRERRAGKKVSELVQAACGESLNTEILSDPSLMHSAALAPEPAPAAQALRSAPSAAEAAAAKAAAPVPAPLAAASSKPLAPAKPPLPPEGRALAGKLLSKDRVKLMAEVLGPEPDLVAEGALLEFKTTIIKSDKIKGKDGKPGERIKLRFTFSDKSDTMIAVFWPKPGEALPSELAPGARVRVRGEAKVDRFERDELVIDARDITLLPAEKGRMDTAAVKRVELHAHTKMSAADSVVNAQALVKTALKWGHPAVAITDHGVVHAFPDAAKAVPYDKAAKQHGIKLILGCEGYLVEDASFLNPDGSLKGEKPPYWHVILLAKNDQGRINLYKLISESHMKTFYKRPLIPRARLEALREGLVVGSACEQGELMQAIIAGRPDADLFRIAAYYDYLEVQPPANNRFMIRQGAVPDEEALRDMVRKVIALGERLEKPVVATGDVHFLHPEDEQFRRMMQVGNGMEDAEEQAPLYFKTTDEMLEDFSFLPQEQAFRAVVEAPRRVAEGIGFVSPVPKDRCFPTLPGSEQRVTDSAWEKLKAVFGPNPPELAAQRLEYELGKITGNGFAVLYEIAQKLVQESNRKGYSVGSRGSVGSSLVAWCLGITEVNPLASYELCPECHWCQFHPQERRSGIDLAARACPQCGHKKVRRDGHNIPFETFVGFKGDKVPDIDLNFAPEVQNEIQRFAVTLFSEGSAFKAGTVSCYSDKTAFGYVKKYFEAKGITKRSAEVERLKTGLMDVKKNTGSHPGGVILVPAGHVIEEFTPVQYSGDSSDRGGREKGSDMPITHFDYHAIDENLVKLDILGKDDGSAFKHLLDITGVPETEVPLDDPAALSIFKSADALKLPKLAPEELQLFGATGALAIPEFGTGNTRRMLEMTKPKDFTELIYISGLSHGTNVWANNAEELVKTGKAQLESVISTRDDIMTRLIQSGMDAAMAFDITEKVRKGKAAAEGFSPEQTAALKAAKVPDWFIESCKKIQYMFPKAHATAYCFTAVRMAWFKVHHPAAFYATWLTLHAENFELEPVSKGKQAIMARIGALRQADQAGSISVKEQGGLDGLVVALEAVLRGVVFKKVSVYLSHPSRFMPVPGAAQELVPPLTAIGGLGSTAAERIAQEREAGPFRSAEDPGRPARF